MSCRHGVTVQDGLKWSTSLHGTSHPRSPLDLCKELQKVTVAANFYKCVPSEKARSQRRNMSQAECGGLVSSSIRFRRSTHGHEGLVERICLDGVLVSVYWGAHALPITGNR